MKDEKPKKTYTVSIEYDGKYPTLCRQNLTVTLTNPKDKNDKRVFSGMTLITGGHCDYSNVNAIAEKKPWTLGPEWPDRGRYKKVPTDFPKEYIPALLCEINTKVEWGCCGGCL